MILADSEADRRKALDELPRCSAFYHVFKACRSAVLSDDRSAAARFSRREDRWSRSPGSRPPARPARRSRRSGLLHRVEQLHEVQPVPAAACGLGIPVEITEMQTRAIIEPACRLNKEGQKVVPRSAAVPCSAT
jgi:hypothetical protein